MNKFFVFAAILAASLVLSGCKDAANDTPIVNAAVPTITEQPVGAEYNPGKPVNPIFVTADVKDNGTLSYQWYVSKDTPISGATSSSYTPAIPDSVGLPETTSYYVVVTNTNAKANGAKSASVTSDIVPIVVQRSDAMTPVIVGQPKSANYFVSVKDTATELTVWATRGDGGTLSYQWYYNTADSTENGTPLNGAKSRSYTPYISTVRTLYYYVVVTNTNNNATEKKVASVISEVVSVAVFNVALPPVITAQPKSPSYSAGSTATLTVAARTDDDGTLSYQWYKNITDSTLSGVLISGAVTAAYTPPTDTVGTIYYYVVVTNTRTVTNGSTTTTTATATSSVVNVTIDAVPIVKVFAGSSAFALGSNGKVYAQGYNREGELGLGDTVERTSFTEVSSLNGRNIIAISSGSGHTVALGSDQKVYATGRNTEYQLGLGNTVDRTWFTEVTALRGKNIIAVSAGADFTFALGSDKKLYAVGKNTLNQTGLPLERVDSTAVPVKSFTEVSVKGASAGQYKDIIAISAGKPYHALALSSDGYVYATGGFLDTPREFTLIPGSFNRGIIAIRAGSYWDAFVLSDDKKVYAAASHNNYGYLGLGGSGSSFDGERVSSFTEVTGLSGKNIIDIGIGDYRTFALSSDKKVYAAGKNDYGGLGLGNTETQTTFTEVVSLQDKNITALSVGYGFAFALSGDGKLYGPSRIGNVVAWTEITISPW